MENVKKNILGSIVLFVACLCAFVACMVIAVRSEGRFDAVYYTCLMGGLAVTGLSLLLGKKLLRLIGFCAMAFTFLYSLTGFANVEFLPLKMIDLMELAYAAFLIISITVKEMPKEKLWFVYFFVPALIFSIFFAEWMLVGMAFSPFAVLVRLSSYGALAVMGASLLDKPYKSGLGLAGFIVLMVSIAMSGIANAAFGSEFYGGAGPAGVWSLVMLGGLFGLAAVPFLITTVNAGVKLKKEPRPKPVAPKAEPAAPAAAADPVEELKKYKQLADNGIITQEDFEAKKKQLLGL